MQVPDVDVIVVPVGGAGLIAGIAMAVKTLRPEVQVMARLTMRNMRYQLHLPRTLLDMSS